MHASYRMMTTAALMICASALAMRVEAHASALPTIATQSAVFVERIDAASTRRLKPAKQLMHGERVVTLVTWYRMGGDGSFTITNPLPGTLYYQSSASERQQVSVDGGRTWGLLGTLRIGNRMATPEDVTHVRWRVPATAAAQGQIAYAGIVR